MERSELMGMHEIGSRGSETAAFLHSWDGPRFLGGSLLLTLVLLATGILSMQLLDAAWVGLLLVFSAVAFSYLAPFLWTTPFRDAWTAEPRE